MEELGLPHSKIRVIPPPLGRTRERRGVIAEEGDRPITYVTPLGAGKLAGARATLSGSQGADVPE